MTTSHTISAALAALASMAVGAATFGQYNSDNIKLYAQLDLNDLNSSSGNDCWGYVSSTGREYVIMGLATRTSFIEVTDPVNPVIVSTRTHSESFTGDIKVLGDYAYSIGDNYNLQIFDLSDIDNGNVRYVGSENFRTHNIALNTDSGYAYMCASTVSSGIAALNLANPENPVVAGSTNPTGDHVHDALVITYTSGQYAGQEIAFCPSGGSGLDIIDVTNKSNMTRLSHTTYPGLGYCHQCWISEDRTYLYVNDEFDELFGATPTTRTLVFNVSNLSNPVLEGTFTSGSRATDHNLFVHEGFIYEGNYRSGVHIFDARNDPVSPPRVGFFDTYPSSEAPGYNGAWAPYPFFPSGTLVVSDIERGLFILDASLARGDRMELNVSDLVGGQNATLSVSGATPGQTVYFAYSTAGEDWTWVSALGVYLDIVNPVLGGSDVADGGGNAQLVKSVPGSASGVAVWVQAAEVGNTSTVEFDVIQ